MTGCEREIEIGGEKEEEEGGEYARANKSRNKKRNRVERLRESEKGPLGERAPRTPHLP